LRKPEQTVYVCAKCGAECGQLIWEAIGVERGEGRCPGCGEWARFEARGQETEVRRQEAA
jgi:DNA-directed RNA polymerase subunit RPC12/RpoP